MGVAVTPQHSSHTLLRELSDLPLWVARAWIVSRYSHGSTGNGDHRGPHTGTGGECVMQLLGCAQYTACLRNSYAFLTHADTGPEGGFWLSNHPSNEDTVLTYFLCFHDLDHSSSEIPCPASSRDFWSVRLLWCVLNWRSSCKFCSLITEVHI